ncbi:MAG: hypothetical protein LC753_02730 [Acidobacteria bacterium]|nr:hypothetical protein [Acidobacteriota bacterium]MCA1649217.1 hypothetical protein [Acidobacteriota bacterium]
MRAALLSSVVVLAGAPAFAQPVPPCAACIAVTVDPGQVLVLPASLEGLDVLVRLAPGEERAAAAALRAIRDRGGTPGLHIAGVPRDVDPQVVALAKSVILDLGARQSPPDDAFVYDLKMRVTQVRSTAPEALRIGIAAAPDVTRALIARDLAPYLDFVVWLGEPDPEIRGPARWRAMAAAVPALHSVQQALVAQRDTIDTERWLWRAPADAIDAGRVLADLARAALLLTNGLAPLPNVLVQCAGDDVPAYLNPATLDKVAFLPECPADSAASVSPPQGAVERTRLMTGGTVIRVLSAEGDRFSDATRVVAARQLSVVEVVARHQAAAARQSAAVRTSIATGTLTLTFEAPGFPAPVTISSEAIIYTSPDRSEIEQRGVRVNGIEFRGDGVPRLPIIEPERIASAPLAITLTDMYRYVLRGRERILETDCYVVAFEPVAGARPLFKGHAWISVESFAMVKVSATQTGLRGAIVASEQTDDFKRYDGGVWLLARSDVRQMYEGAAHRTPIHRVLAISRHEINPATFDERRAAAYASASIMLRDTPQGYRYLQRARGGAAGSAEPTIASRADRVRTLAMGVIIDPNISRPLPFAGLSYVDFNLFGTGTQFSGFFGGTYAQVAFSVPSVRGSRWQLAGRAFGIASSYNDRAFVDGREIYEDDIRQRPAHASVWLLRPLSPRIAVRAGYDLDYTHFAAGDATTAAFVVPPAQLVHAARLAIDSQRAGWNFTLWWNPAMRSGWRAWGRGGEYRPSHRSFQRYGASLSRSAVLTPRLVARAEAAGMGGRDLDRFSRYSFGTFDNRLRGYPSALVRYDRGGVLRGAVGWAAGRLVRLDGFLDTAWVHDPGFGAGLRNYTGIGGAVEAPAPFGTLLALEWGYGIQGIDTTGGRGTHVMRVSGYKVF